MVDAVRQRLERFGLYFADRGILEAMLRSGDFALVLDGMNEAERDLSVQSFGRSFPRTRLLITSQGNALADFALWRLPDTIVSFCELLIVQYRPAEEARLLMQQLSSSGLLPHLRSGYDVRLVLDIARGGPSLALPASRLDLYRATVARAMRDFVGVEPDVLKELGWTMVLERRHTLNDGDRARLGPKLLRLLDREGIRILRRVGEVYKFRHDQMRNFLAASFLVEDTPNIEACAQRIADTDVWMLGRKEQEELWTFLANMLSKPEDLDILWHLATRDPARGFLLQAIIRRAEACGLTLLLRPPAARMAEPVS